MLTSIDAVKSHLGISKADADAVLTALVKQCSAQIENYIGRRIESNSWSEAKTGNGRPTMMLAQGPIVAITSLGIGLETLSPSEYYISESGLSVCLRNRVFTRGSGVYISYQAGYAAVPADIELACIEAVALAFNRRNHIDVSSKSIAGETVSYITAEFPPSALKTLQQYKKVAPV